MFYALKIFFRDLYIVVPFGVLTVVLGLTWWYILSHIHPTENQVFLHYNIIFGIDLAGTWQKMYFLPAGATLSLFVNLICSFFLYRADKILARVVALIGLFIGLFLAYALYLIVGLNI